MRGRLTGGKLVLALRGFTHSQAGKAGILVYSGHSHAFPFYNTF